MRRDVGEALRKSHCDVIRYAELAAKRLGYSFQLLDIHSGYLCKVSNGDKSVHIGGGLVNAWPVNEATAATIATDKGFTTLVLNSNGIATPAGKTLFLSKRFCDLREGGRELEDAAKLADKIGWPIIAKPNNGARGAYVQLCRNPEELNHHLAHMSQRYDIGILQEYVRGDEFRVFVYGDKAVFSYKKRRGALAANGTSTVRELVEEFSQKLSGKGLDPVDLNSSWFLETLKTHCLKVDEVPTKGLKINIGARANLSAGGSPEDFITEVPQTLSDLAIRATKAIGLVVAGINLIVPAGASRAVVLEVNSNPSISSLETVGRLESSDSVISAGASADLREGIIRKRLTSYVLRKTVSSYVIRGTSTIATDTAF